MQNEMLFLFYLNKNNKEQDKTLYKHCTFILQISQKNANIM